MFSKFIKRLARDVEARFIEDALYIAGAVLVVISVLFALGPKIAAVFSRIIESLP